MIIQTAHGPLAIDLEAYDLPPAFPLLLPVCRRLQLAATVDRFCPMKQGAHLTHGQITEFLVLHMLQSEHRLPLYKLDQWAAAHNLHRLYDHEAAAFNDDRVGRALDALAGAIAEIEAAVVTTALGEYAVEARTIHWDLTHVTFSGRHEHSELICSGYGHGQVHDRQLQVSLHATSEGGIPVRHEALGGSQHQAPLAPAMLADLQQRLQRSDLIVVSDRAGISYDNIRDYRRAKAHFLGPLQINAPEHREQLAAPEAQAFRPLSYHSRNAPHDGYSYVPTVLRLKPQKKHSPPLAVAALLIYSQRKALQEAQHRQRQLQRCGQRLQTIAGHLNKRRYAQYDYAQNQVRKAIPPALTGLVGYQLSGPPGQLVLHFWTDQQALAQAARCDGRYFLVYDLPPDRTPDDIFTLYRRHTVIEARFRNFHSDLSVHPLWLHKDRRIQALLLVFVLALIVYTLLELCSERAQLQSPHYHKLTARQLIFQFGRVRLKEVTVAGQAPQFELVLSDHQRYLVSQLRLPDPTRYLTRRSPPTPDPPHMCGN
jgi:transposase